MGKKTRSLETKRGIFRSECRLTIQVRVGLMRTGKNGNPCIEPGKKSSLGHRAIQLGLENGKACKTEKGFSPIAEHDLSRVNTASVG